MYSAIHRATRRAEPGGFGNPAGKPGMNPGIHRGRTCDGAGERQPFAIDRPVDHEVADHAVTLAIVDRAATGRILAIAGCHSRGRNQEDAEMTARRERGG
jgi:hypothetical protein